MKREDVVKIFPDATDGQIDDFLNRVGSELNPLKKELKETTASRDEAQEKLTKAEAANQTYEEQVKDLSEKVKAGMTAEELLAQQQEQAAEKEREFTLKSNAVDAKSLFVEAGCFDDETITTLVEQVTGEDLDATLAKAKSIIEVVQRHGKAVEETTKNELLKGNPKLKGGGDGDPQTPKTVKEFLALPYDKQLELKGKDPSILTNLSKE